MRGWLRGGLVLGAALLCALPALRPGARAADQLALGASVPVPERPQDPGLGVWSADRLAQWASLTARLGQESASPPTAALRAWHKALAPLRGKPLDRQIEAVNAYVNAAPWISDEENYGVSDLWATPGQFLTRGGDCEDYAIAKFFSLLRLGVPADHMRILVVHDSVRDLVHAVLEVTTPKGAVVLDNLAPEVIPVEKAQQYQALYSVNLQHLWLHKAF